MFIIKLYYHIVSIVKIFFFKILYGRRVQIPMNLSFRRGFSLVIEDDAKIVIGDNCFFNNNVTLASMSEIRIGEGTLFGENVKVYDHNHCYRDTDINIKDQGYTHEAIVIGKHCWVASNVVILKGVHIGDNCVIGAGCVIYKDIPSNSIVVNNTQLCIKKY